MTAVSSAGEKEGEGVAMFLPEQSAKARFVNETYFSPLRPFYDEALYLTERSWYFSGFSDDKAGEQATNDPGEEIG